MGTKLHSGVSYNALLIQQQNLNIKKEILKFKNTKEIEFSFFKFGNVYFANFNLFKILNFITFYQIFQIIEFFESVGILMFYFYEF